MMRWAVRLAMWTVCALSAYAGPPTVVSADRDTIPRVSGPLLVEPLTFARKSAYYAKDAFSPASLLLPALPAALLLANPPDRYPREWRNGGAAFGRNFGDSLGTELAAKTGKYLVGALTHEDPRYYPSQSHNVARRTWHALAFTLIDRNDNGNKTLAVSNLAGSAAAGFLGRAYLPGGFNDVTHAGQRAAGTLVGYNPTLLVGFATQNLLEEYLPDLKKLGRKLHLPFFPNP